MSKNKATNAQALVKANGALLMSLNPEALARLREKRARCDKFCASSIDVEADDLRALLDAYDTARAEGVAAERARVVADLRRQAHNLKGGLSRLAPDVLDAAADYFERGEHDKEGER